MHRTHRISLAAACAFALAMAALPAAWAQRGPGGPGATADTSAIKTKWLDLPYATVSAAQKLDIYLPNTGAGPFPVVLSIHGGAFQSGDKNGAELASAVKLLDAGYAVASINYRLSGEARWPAQIHDVKAAIRYLRANAARYKLDPDKIAAWGGSAGGHLAALAGTSGGVQGLSEPALGNAGVSDRLQAVVDMFGPINFLTMDDQFKAAGVAGQVHNAADSPESALMGKQLTLAPTLVKQANPETYISADDPPFMIQHGTADVLIPSQQSVDFAAALRKVLGEGKVGIELLQGAGHAGAAFFTDANIKKVVAFLDTHLR
jgi:acetyl esterase/lipase